MFDQAGNLEDHVSCAAILFNASVDLRVGCGGGSCEEHERVREGYTNEFNRIVVGQSTCTYLQREL